MASSSDACARRRWGVATAVAALATMIVVVTMRARAGNASAGEKAAAIVAAAQPAAPRASPSLAGDRAGASTLASPSSPAASLPSSGALPPPPPSLRGTDVDGELTLDARGRFVATASARQLFDYFLTTDGEEAPAAIRARVAAEAARRLPASEAAAALALFDRYVDYRDRLGAAVATAARGDPLAVLAESEQLQRELFGAEDAERLFGDDDRLARSLLERDGAGLADGRAR